MSETLFEQIKTSITAYDKGVLFNALRNNPNELYNQLSALANMYYKTGAELFRQQNFNNGDPLLHHVNFLCPATNIESLGMVSGAA
jgi:hypothetical protein